MVRMVSVGWRLIIKWRDHSIINRQPTETIRTILKTSHRLNGHSTPREKFTDTAKMY